ncbi:MAG: thrombospondin type 3 repeat-containing protein, partial [Verrucomicrobiota bacterium]|nr:thrombospondin type 3 repeat-containing protein [Verrucomicrobiota bacterium]
TTSGYREIFDDRRSAYDQSLVLLNNTSHDEAPYSDSWEALIRYATVSTNDGSPMIMYGQEIGAGQKFQESLPQGAFDWYENNFGKDIPSFKKWNSMQAQWTAWTNNDAGVQFLYPVYSGIGKAREFSPALRSSNRWYLNPDDSLEPDEDIFAVAKYTEANALVAEQDVVIAFTNLDRDNTQANNFGIPTTLADLIGLQVDRKYNAKNIAAYLGRDNEHPTRRDTWLWGSGYTRDDLVNNGLFVSLNPVPGDDLTWSTNPYEAQYLKVYDVTAPVASPAQPQQPKPFDYEIGDTVTFDWPDVAPDAGGVVPHYEVTPYINSITQATIITTVSEYTITASESDLVAITVKAVNPEVPSNAGPSSIASANIKLLPAAMDEDGDGMSNSDEDSAGTNPLDNGSNFSVSSQTLENNGDVTIKWTPVAGKTYKVQSSLSLAPDSWIDEASGLSLGTYADQPEISESKKFYRVVIE